MAWPRLSEGVYIAFQLRVYPHIGTLIQTSLYRSSEYLLAPRNTAPKLSAIKQILRPFAAMTFLALLLSVATFVNIVVAISQPIEPSKRPKVWLTHCSCHTKPVDDGSRRRNQCCRPCTYIVLFHLHRHDSDNDMARPEFCHICSSVRVLRIDVSILERQKLR